MKKHRAEAKKSAKCLNVSLLGEVQRSLVMCLQTSFQSSIDLDIHLNSRKEDLNLKFRKK